MRNPVIVAVGVVVLALAVRLVAYELVWPDRLHGTSAQYASAALGLLHGRGPTVAAGEVARVGAARGHLADFRAAYTPGAPRQPMYGFLPGGAYVMAGVWRVTGSYDFRPYIYLQALLDSLLCLLLLALLRPYGLGVAALGALTWAFFLPQVRLVCTPSYDFWPSLCYVTGVWAAATFWRQRVTRPGWGTAALALGGVGAGVALCMREIMLAFPVLLCLALVWLLRREPRRWPRLLAYAVPCALLLAALLALRFQQTGELRATRGIFWHSFWAGVGQFPNPYGVVHDDVSVHEFAERRNPAVAKGEWYINVPGNVYERTLKAAAQDLVRDHPWLLVRNAVLRSGMVLIPALFPTDAFFSSPQQRTAARAVGWLLLPLQLLGALHLWRRDRALLLLLAVPLAATIAVLAPFYLVSRALVSVFFVHVALIVLGLVWLAERRRRRCGKGAAVGRP